MTVKPRKVRHRFIRLSGARTMFVLSKQTVWQDAAGVRPSSTHHPHSRPPARSCASALHQAYFKFVDLFTYFSSTHRQTVTTIRRHGNEEQEKKPLC